MNPIKRRGRRSLFGPGPATRQQLDCFRIDNISHASITRQVASATIGGDFGQFFEPPAGAIKFACGGEYRRGSSRFDPGDDLLRSRFFHYGEPGLVQASNGHFDVKEAFGELDVPIVAPQRFRYPAPWQHDARVRLEPKDGFACSLGVNNFANQKPHPYSCATNVPISPRGRYLHSGMRFDLGR